MQIIFKSREHDNLTHHYISVRIFKDAVKDEQTQRKSNDVRKSLEFPDETGKGTVFPIKTS